MTFPVDSIKTLVAGEISLFDDTSKLKSISVVENDIDHTLYVYTIEEGQPSPAKGNPTVMDSSICEVFWTCFFRIRHFS